MYRYTPAPTSSPANWPSGARWSRPRKWRCTEAPKEESLKGFLEQGSRFLNPVFVGDTLYCTRTVSDLKPGNTTGVITLGTEVKNQKGVVVMDGFQKYLLRKRHPGQ